MDYTIIEVPNRNDSISKIVLDGVLYNLRFTYNDTADCWMFGIYNDLVEPIVTGIKIVPRFSLTTPYTVWKIPTGVFAVLSKLDHIGKNDFFNGSAQFIYAPLQQ